MADTLIIAPSSTPTADENTQSTNVGNDLDDLIAASSSGNVDNPNKSKVAFGTSDDPSKKEKAQQEVLRSRKVPKRIMMLVVVLILLLGVSSLGYLFYQYMIYQEAGTVNSYVLKYMPWVEDKYTSIIDNFGLEKDSKYTSQSVVSTDPTVVGKIVQDKNLGFISKKKLLQEGIKQLYLATSKKYDTYDAMKKEVGQQGFFPKDIQTIAQGVFFDNSLQKAIISIESVRFATSLKFFSVLDSFLSQLSSFTQTSKEDLMTQLQVFIERGEKDINNYIVSCYLNGYEISTQCNTIGDFGNYYRFYQDSGINQKTFLYTMNALEAKLENTDFPSLEITMKSINPLNNTINLGVEINTFKDDEVQLSVSKGILNPHIYLVTSIINNLRESRYVLTDSINVNSLKVNKKKIKVGGQTVVVNSSTFNFTLPIQNNVQREIYDFSDDISQKLPGLKSPVDGIIPSISTTGTTTTNTGTSTGTRVR